MKVISDLLIGLLSLCMKYLIVPEKNSYWLELEKAGLSQGV